MARKAAKLLTIPPNKPMTAAFFSSLLMTPLGLML
jgi:hypothetical protein